MAAWAKIKFFWETMLGSTGSTLTASSTASGYDAKNIYDMLETTMWKAGSVTPPQTITYDAGAGNTKTADYIIFLGHNFSTAGASVYIEYSDNGTAWTEAWSTTPTSDKALLAEFTNPGAHRYWRVRLFKSPTDFNALPYITICIWGLKTELDYASASYDPDEQETKANVNVSDTGYLLGIHRRYTERSMTLRFEDADSALYAKVRNWWETSGLKNFFVAVDTANRPNDVFLMRPDPKFSNPLKAGGLYRDITVSLKGRKE